MKNIHLLLAFFAISSCGKPPGKVIMDQLTETPYYEQEVENGEATKIRLKYKPSIYSYSGKPYTGKVSANHLNGKTKLSGSMKNGFPDGSWTRYYEDGRVESRGHYNEGTPDSIWQKYFKDGNKSVTEKYYMIETMLRCDTIEAWYDWNKKKIETQKDSIKLYFYSGKLASLTIGNRFKEQWVYTKDGKLVTQTKNYRKVTYDSGGRIVKRTYYLHNEEGKAVYEKAKEKVTTEQREAIEKADSVEFDFLNEWDPIVRIYLAE